MSTLIVPLNGSLMVVGLLSPRSHWVPRGRRPRQHRDEDHPKTAPRASSPSGERRRRGDRGENRRVGSAEGIERRAARSRAVAANRAVVLVAAALALAAISLVVVPGSPAYDPWAWILWGREVAHLDLTTAHGPSFKPLPVAVTTILSIFGGAAPALWLVVVRAAGIVAVVTAFRVAARLAPDAKVFAGLVAAGGVLLIDGFLVSVGRGWSEFLVPA